MMRLSEEDIKSFVVAEIYREPSRKKTNSIVFSEDGKKLISSTQNEQLVVFDPLSGELSHRLNCKKYGIDLLEYIHEKNHVLHSSTKINDIMRYLDVEANQYLRYFMAHTRRVVSLSSHPRDMAFISCSEDRTLRLWDVRTSSCHEIMYLPTIPIASYAPHGLTFTVALESQEIRLHDLRSISQGAFQTMRLPQQTNGEWMGLKFSGDGRKLLINTNTSALHLFDAYTSNLIYTLSDYKNDLGIPIEACFTPDSKFILSGSTDGRVHIWSVESGNKIAELRADSEEPITRMKFNSKFTMFVTAGINTTFWLCSTR